MNFVEHMSAMYRSWRDREPINSAPVLPGMKVLGHLPTFRSNAFAVLSEASTLGDVVRFDLLHTPVFFVKHPDAVGPMLDSQELWLRGEGLQPLLGRNVLSMNGAEWQASRTFAQPTFHPKMTDLVAQDFVQRAITYLDKWHSWARSQTEVDLAREAICLFTQCATPAFGFRFLPEETEAFPAAILRLQQWAFAALAGGKRRSRKVSQDMAMLDGIIERSLNRPPATDQPPTYLDRLRQDHSIPRDSLRDHLMLMLIASSDNPPNTFAFVIKALLDNPEWEEAARAEIADVLGDEPPTVASLESLPLLSRIVDETLRYYPPVWMLARHSTRDVELLEHHIPAGTMALIGTYFIHRHPEFWEDPEQFNPDRFLPHREAERHRYAYLPFGSGPRRCIGSRIALQEVRLLLALFLQRFRVIPTHTGPLPLNGIFALRSTIGVPCLLQELTS
ncbi:MAG: cytochrome P450 [Deltaproteobacteria bacterium]|nr:MAG: cytochrome P450 [Deltaproteobacteria bacterium]